MSTEYEGEASRRMDIYRGLGQGLTVFFEAPNAEVDIIAVPGLGTNPEECWKWSPNPKDNSGVPKPSFNWIKDPDGLASLFPRSRIMLYDYASAWKGQRKVRATMKGLCVFLLDILKEKRKGDDEVTRPLIMIGHSMGGIVIAKTLCIAKAKREFEAIVTCTMGCVFFGAPFRGSNMAKLALMYSNIFGNDAYDSLLSFMKAEKNDVLDEVTDDFMDISNKLNPPIELFCAYEQVPTAVSYTDKTANKIPALLEHKVFKNGARAILNVGISTLGGGTHFVDKESATLKGAYNVGLTAGHSDLVKFENITSDKFSPVRTALARMVSTAIANVRRRTATLGQSFLSPKFINQVRQSLEGVDMRSKYRTIVRQREVTSWLVSEPSYQEWLQPVSGKTKQLPYLWLKGGPGLGKTNACLAAINNITQANLSRESSDTAQNQSETLLAYFLCDESSGYCTAEDVLKSLVIQIINQEESLAHHARWFIPNPRYRGPASDEGSDTSEFSNAKATATVDNLWKCLQDIMEDPILNSIHIIVSNIHCLESSASTIALLAKLGESACSAAGMPFTPRRAKWLLTSRNDVHVSNYLTCEYILMIDLENDLVYGAQVRTARQKHAKEAILELRRTKNYGLDLSYYVKHSIERQSEDEKWTDVLCSLLKARPNDSNFLDIKKWLKEVGQKKIQVLVEHAWHDILHRSDDASPELEELMQVLTITYEPPSLADLAILTRVDSLEHLADLVRLCSPVLTVGEWRGHRGRVLFTDSEFEKRLSIFYYGDAESKASQRIQYHGVVALRCFQYIKSSYQPRTEREVLSAVPTTLTRSLTTTARLVERNKIIEITNEDEEADDANVNPGQSTNLDRFYPIKYLFRHLSEAPPDAVQDLYENDPDFFGLESDLRTSFLTDFKALTSDLKDLDANGMSALHIAAGIGADQVASLLVLKNGEESLTWTNEEGMTALHVAAFNNHAGVVDKLIREGADIEAGEGGIGTALHFAALRGNCGIMTVLIDQGANVNALSQKIGPVINAAVRSGTVDAVKQIMDKDVRFDLDYTKCDPPLSLSAGISEPKLFEKILQTGKGKWLQNVKLLEGALVAASYSGRLESVRILLTFEDVYSPSVVAQAMLTAATEKNWAAVGQLLDYSLRHERGKENSVDLDNTFYVAATSREERIDILEKLWTLTSQTIPQDVRNFSLYQATVLNKESTCFWLLRTAEASANASGERPSSIHLEYTNIGSTSDYLNALNAAATIGNATVVRDLIKHGAEINHNCGYALHLAARGGQTQIVEILLEAGAFIDKEAVVNEDLGFEGETALLLACDNSRVSTVQVLIEHASNPNLGGGRPLNYPIIAATQRAEPEILKMLLDVPDVNVNVIGGDTQASPLINAAANMSIECVELLVRKGADIDAKDSTGDTALIMAAARGDMKCIDLLCKEGVDVTYRSPGRGLAIQVAAEKTHPVCAQFLTDKMVEKIEYYREEAKIDPSRKDLDIALATLEERKWIIEELEGHLTEAREQLEIARNETEVKRGEIRAIQAEMSYLGSTYESHTQRMKIMEMEQNELRKELDASKGMTQMANDRVVGLQTRLDRQMEVNEELRKRKAWNALEDEKLQAIHMLEDEKKAGLERARHEHQQRAALQDEISNLRREASRAEEQAQAASLAKKTAEEWASNESQKHEETRREFNALRTKHQKLNETIKEIQAAAVRDRDTTPSEATLPSSANFPIRQPNVRPSRRNSSMQLKDPGNNDGPSTTSPPLVARKPVQLASPETTPPLGSVGGYGFKTVHGDHRADGSLTGGYRPGAGNRRINSDGLPNGLVRKQSGGVNSTSGDSLYEDQPDFNGRQDSPRSQSANNKTLNEQPSSGPSNGQVRYA